MTRALTRTQVLRGAQAAIEARTTANKTMTMIRHVRESNSIPSLLYFGGAVRVLTLPSTRSPSLFILRRKAVSSWFCRFRSTTVFKICRISCPGFFTLTKTFSGTTVVLGLSPYKCTFTENSPSEMPRL